MAYENKYLLGQGKVYVALRDATAIPLGFSLLGNVSTVDLSLGSYGEQYAVGGTETLRKMNTPSTPPMVELQIESLTKENLAMALYGQMTATSAGTKSGDDIVARLGKTVPLSNINITSFTSLTNTGGTTTYTPGTEYVVNMGSGSIEFMAGGRITEGQTVRANYAYGASEKISAYTMAPPLVWVRFEGVNLANGKPVVVDLYKVRFPALEALSLIGDSTLSTLRMKGRIMRDQLQSGNTSDGQIMRIRQG